jgi:predicted HTH domain antitoxin
MNTRILEIPYPEDLPESLGETHEEFENHVRFLVAGKLYELGRISSGRAAELAGMGRVEFLEKLGSRQISVFNYSLDELEREILAAKERAEMQK